MAQFDPNDLLIFAAVADGGSFSRAAERLGLPRSTVSRRIALLEERLGQRLLLRTTRRVTITEFGQKLLEHARQVAAEVAAAEALGEHHQVLPSGRLRVSIPSDFANILLVDMFAAFVALHPAVTLELDLSPRRVDLLAENFDVAVRIGKLPDDGLLAARRLAIMPSGLYAAPSYLAERGDLHSPEELMAHNALRLISSSGEAVGWTLLRDGQRWEGAPPSRTAANSPELLMRLAAAGAGIAPLPEFFAAPAVRGGELRRVLPDWSLPVFTAWAVFPGRRLMAAKTRAFIDMLVAALNSCNEDARAAADSRRGATRA
ncbi:MAG: LysR family transcriptional regulator [Burkholderiaceae bacterium]|nr:LysR family transcriptional regulator [Burkholderiaceae bacterium]